MMTVIVNIFAAAGLTVQRRCCYEHRARHPWLHRSSSNILVRGICRRPNSYVWATLSTKLLTARWTSNDESVSCGHASKRVGPELYDNEPAMLSLKICELKAERGD